VGCSAGQAAGGVGLVTTYGLFAAALFAAAIVGRRRSQAAG
jgi:MYXO-CTERM domain-containing protein